MPAPSAALTPGLDFSNVSYGKPTAQRFAAETQVARQILKEKLQVSLDRLKCYESRSSAQDISTMSDTHLGQTFGELKSVFSVTLADGAFTEPPIWIDARSSPVKFLETSPPDGPAPAFEITLKPEQIEWLSTGFGEDPQAVVFLQSERKGDTIQAVQFADLLTPNPSKAPTPKNDLNLDELPKPTEDINQVRRDIRRWGYG